LLKIINFLSSRRLAVTLVLLVAAVVLIAAFIPQGRADGYYKEHYKVWAYNALILLGIDDLPRSWFFLALSASLSVNLAFCVALRLAAFFAAVRFHAPGTLISGRDYQTAEVGSERDFGLVSTRLRTLPFRWREADGVIFGRRRPLALVGPSLIHVGLLLALLAFFWGTFGRREGIFVFEGQGVVLRPAFGRGIEVRADHVDELTDANTGKIISRRAKVRLLRRGEELTSAELEVNKPLRYDGLSIYQSGMSTSGAKGLLIEEVELREGAKAADYGRAAFSWIVGRRTGEITLAPGDTRPLGDTGFKLRYVDYVEALNATEAGISDDGPDYNPAALVQLLNAAGDTAEGVLFKLYPERSFMRGDASAFADKGVRVDYNGDGGPWRAARRKLLVASGARVTAPGGKGSMKIVMGPGESSDLRERYLDCVIDDEGRALRVKLPFGKRVSVATGEGTYIYRFMGSGVAPVTALTVARDPGLTVFYAACLLFALGLVIVTLWHYDELAAYVHGGRVYLTGRSSGSGRELESIFDTWGAAAEETPLSDEP
jgi:hypothetical protein